MPSLYYADNTPAYYTSRPPAYREVAFEIVAQGEVEHTAPDDICDPTRQTMFVRVHALRGDDGGLSARDAQSLIAGVLSPDRCYCDHDCCGHRTGWADVDFLTMDTARVVVRTARNF
jgi:hypothetical protein